MFRVEDISDDDPDEHVAKSRTDMGGEILDTWVNLLPVTQNPWKQEDGAMILHLGVNIVNERRGRGKIEHRTYI
jgi:hypothetical protein